MASKTDICNLAVSHLAIGQLIANVDTDTSEEAITCRLFYDDLRNDLLRSFDWPFASKVAALGLVANDPTTEWKYSYRYPSDCIKIRRIVSGTRNDNRQTRVPYKFSNDSEGRLIYSDITDACIEYTMLASDTTLYSPDFIFCLSFLIAHNAAPRLTDGDPNGLGNITFQKFINKYKQATANAANEEQQEEDPPSEFIRAREGDTINGAGLDPQSFPGAFVVS